jgi:hypothetical protein
MNGRRCFLYPTPDGAKTMLAIEDRLQIDGEEPPFEWDPVGASVVRVESDVAAIYLRANFEYRPVDIHGGPLLEPNEIWVDDGDRDECERVLRENCPSSATWFDLFEVSFATDDEHREFAAAYTQITGLPSAFSREPNAGDICPLADGVNASWAEASVAELLRTRRIRWRRLTSGA